MDNESQQKLMFSGLTSDEAWPLEEVLFDARRSRRYHDRRAGCLENIQRFKSFATVVFGSAAIVAALSTVSPTVVIVTSSLVVILSAIDLVYNLTLKSQKHLDLRNRFIQLEKSVVGDEHPTPAKIAKWKQRLLVIEIDEGPILNVLNCICHNEQLRSEGYPEDKLVEIKWYQRLAAPFFDIRFDKIKQRTPIASDSPKSLAGANLAIVDGTPPDETPSC